MPNLDSLSLLSRRKFTTLAAASLGALTASAHAQTSAEKEVHDAIPGDPGAPAPELGTVEEAAPFAGKLEYARRNAAIRVQPFPMQQVRLLPSVFLDTQNVNMGVLRAMPAGRLLHTFRLNAGLPSTAEPLGGWEKPTSELRGHYIGHYLSGCALMVASTNDAAIKAKADMLVAELAKCQEKLGGGYLSAFPLTFFDRLKVRKKVWAPFYTLHKIMAGLLDMHEYCDSAQALAVLEDMAAWADVWTAALTEDQMQSVLDTEYGGMNDIFYKLAVVTNKPHYVAVGDRFTKKRFFNPLALRRDELLGLHANTHIPQVIGAAQRYEMSSDPRFHDVAEFFWLAVAGTRSYATGGTSNNEGWLVTPNHQAQELRIDSVHSKESIDRGSAITECCCSYNMLKLSRKLYSWTADARYFDFYERILYNHRLGTIDLKTGNSQYYLGIVPGSWRTFGSLTNSFWCCNGTAAEEYAKLNDSIYFRDDEGVYVNLFIPSELNWAEKGVRLRQENNFPQHPQTTLTFAAAGKATPLSVHVRIPAWVAKGASVSINGRPVEALASPGSYLTLRRVWSQGDKIEIALPMSLRHEATPDDPSLKAFFYGPLLLAGTLGNEGISPELINDRLGPDLHHHPFQAPNLSKEIVATGQPLQFRAEHGRGTIDFKPLYQVTDGRFSVYWSVEDQA